MFVLSSEDKSVVTNITVTPAALHMKMNKTQNFLHLPVVETPTIVPPSHITRQTTVRSRMVSATVTVPGL